MARAQYRQQQVDILFPLRLWLGGLIGRGEERRRGKKTSVSFLPSFAGGTILYINRFFSADRKILEGRVFLAAKQEPRKLTPQEQRWGGRTSLGSRRKGKRKRDGYSLGGKQSEDVRDSASCNLLKRHPLGKDKAFLRRKERAARVRIKAPEMKERAVEP